MCENGIISFSLRYATSYIKICVKNVAEQFYSYTKGLKPSLQHLILHKDSLFNTLYTFSNIKSLSDDCFTFSLENMTIAESRYSRK